MPMPYRRLLASLLAALLVAACAPGAKAPPAAQSIPDGVPHTAQAFADDPGNFQFAIVGDRTGGHRPGVFEDGVRKLNLLNPEFTICVGDLIEGYTEEGAELAAMWQEFDAIVAGLDAPFFYVVGNHDMGNATMRALWQQEKGRDYYHFVYRDVLFLALNTEDPPSPLPKKLNAQIKAFTELSQRDPRAAEELVKKNRGEMTKLRAAFSANISDAQVDYVARALADNPGVRWTLVFMHKPAWRYGSKNFERIEQLLAARPYTVFAGHEHYYEHEVRKGRDYIRMGTTGGSWHKDGPGNMDHVAWVTMGKDGPEVANLLLSGIAGKQAFTTRPR